MKKTFLTLVSLLALSQQALAFNHNHQHSEISEKLETKPLKNSDCKNQALIKVNGLVCDFCARSIEKLFSKTPQVAGVNVDLANGKVTIAFRENQSISDAELKQLITNSGYDVVAIERGCK